MPEVHVTMPDSLSRMNRLGEAQSLSELGLSESNEKVMRGSSDVRDHSGPPLLSLGQANRSSCRYGPWFHDVESQFFRLQNLNSLS